MKNFINQHKKDISIITIALILLTSFVFIYNELNKPQVITYNKFVKQIEADNVKSVDIDLSAPTFIFITKDGTKFQTDSPKTDDFKYYLLKNDIKVSETKNALATTIPYLIQLMIYGVLIFFLIKIMSGGNTIAKIQEEKPNTTLDDIAGYPELKKDVNFILNYFKDPKSYENVGAKMPKGVILFGPPGTGKTLVARAIAGTANINFLNVSGADFIEKYVGVGAARIRALYSQARKNAPCIVFIDELDAIGNRRDNEGKNSESVQTINALLKELDGFQENEGVLTICATNRVDTLDSALIRPGRFDKHIAVNLPDKNDRYEILKVHSKNKILDKSIDLKSIADMSYGFSGASLEALLNESAFLAANNKHDRILKEDLETSLYKILMKGDVKENQGLRTAKESQIVAWHEAGHAFATKLYTGEDVTKVTIMSFTSGAGGVTFRNQKERMLYSKKYLKNCIRIMYAGRISEMLLLNDLEEITTGASEDIKQASMIIKEYLVNYGMDNSIGPINLEVFQTDANYLFKEASNMAKNIYKETLDELVSYKNVIEAIATELLDKETIDNAELDSIIAKFNI